MGKKFYTPQQIADMLQVGERDVLFWLEQKELSGINIGTIWRVRDDQFDQFIEHKATGFPQPVEEVVPEEADDDALLPPVRFRRSSNKKGTQRYSKLNVFLARRNASMVRLSFEEIESIIGRELPASAKEHRAFWANDPKHSQAKAWLDAGMYAKDLNLDTQAISFIRKK